MTTWVIEGVDRDSGEARTLHIEATSSSAARAEADEAGFDVRDVRMMEHHEKPTPRVVAKLPVRGPRRSRELGLSKGESWIVGIIGLVFSPALVGIPLLVWAWLAQRRFAEQG